MHLIRTTDSEHRVERLSHATYGLILLTAAVGEMRAEVLDPGSAAALLLGGAVVLILAHTYSRFVGTAAGTDSVPSWREAGALLVDQLALGVSAIVAAAILLLADGGTIEVQTAYDLVLVGALLALFLLGAAMASHHQRRSIWIVGLGVANLALGVVIVGIETLAAH